MLAFRVASAARPVKIDVVGYRSPLEARIAKKATKAITDFNLVEDGDRIMVGLSGGKDSWALIQILDVLQQRAPIDFSIVAVNVDSGYEGYQHTQVAAACAERGWEFHSEHTTIGAVIDDKLDSDQTPCSLCARLRRGVLYRLAKQTGATKIALGHHLDDFVETVLLNLFFAGALKAMPARLTSDNGEHVVIRPLVYVTEAEARAYCKERELPIIGCCCPACGDLGLQRQRVKRLIVELEREHPNVKASMIKALANVMPRHLLDRRLNPVGEIRKAIATRLDEFDDVPAEVPLIPLMFHAGSKDPAPRTIGTPKPQASSPQPQAPSPKPQVPGPRPESPSPKSQAPSPG
jgi:tRNA 2-thiocytidine biosynthesis protein TtcA